MNADRIDELAELEAIVSSKDAEILRCQQALSVIESQYAWLEQGHSDIGRCADGM